MIKLHVLIPLQLGGAIFALLTFNYLNKAYDAEQLSDLYARFNFFILSTFILNGAKEFFVSRDHKISRSHTAATSVVIGFLSSIVFVSLLFFNGIPLVSGGLNPVFYWFLILLFFSMFSFSEIINHQLLSMGIQLYVVVLRFLPLLVLSFLIFLRIDMTFELFLLANLTPAALLTIYVVTCDNVISSNSKYSGAKLSTDFVKPLMIFAYPFLLSSIFNFISNSIERSLWFSGEPSASLAYQGFLALYAAFFAIFIFPVVNFVWGKMESFDVYKIYQIMFRFQILAVCCVIVFVFVGKFLLSFMFSSFSSSQIDTVFYLSMVLVFSSPLLLQSFVIGRYAVRLGYAFFGIVVESVTYLLTIISLIFFSFCDIWLGYASLLSHAVFSITSLLFLFSKVSSSFVVLVRSAAISFTLGGIFFGYYSFLS